MNNLLKKLSLFSLNIKRFIWQQCWGSAQCLGNWRGDGHQMLYGPYIKPLKSWDDI